MVRDRGRSDVKLIHQRFTSHFRLARDALKNSDTLRVRERLGNLDEGVRLCQSFDDIPAVNSPPRNIAAMPDGNAAEPKPQTRASDSLIQARG